MLGHIQVLLVINEVQTFLLLLRNQRVDKYVQLLHYNVREAKKVTKEIKTVQNIF
uniref:Uncharacterized protein n=1 Tax=Arundo donax TaxID=35708 RepID=A0A0A9PG77_ARUDO